MGLDCSLGYSILAFWLLCWYVAGFAQWMSVALQPFWALAIAVVLPAMLIFLFSGSLVPLGQTVDNSNPLQWISPGRWFSELLTGWNYYRYPDNFFMLPDFKNR